MGTCMQTELSSTRFHPLLGHLIQTHTNSENYIDLRIPITSEEQYISWSKNINKLKYSKDINNIIYLPYQEFFHDSEGFCETSHQIVLRFKSYNETLVDNLKRNRDGGNRYREGQLWYLIYTIIKYVQYFEKSMDNHTRITPNCLLIAHDGSLKVIPEIIVPSLEVQSQLILRNGQVEDQFTNQDKKGKSGIYVAGVMSLALAGLHLMDNVYSQAKRTWIDLTAEKREKLLSACDNWYNPRLAKTIREMTDPNEKQRVNITQLLKRLEIFQNQMNANPNKIVFGGSTTETDREILLTEGMSLKNSNLGRSDVMKLQESSFNYGETYTLKKNEEKSVNEDEYPSIL